MILPLMGLVTALVSKSCTTLSASSFEDVSSVSGSHSLSEAMYLASLSLLRLICSKHFNSSLTQSQISISSENLYYYITHNALCQVFLIANSQFVFKM